MFVKLNALVLQIMILQSIAAAASTSEVAL